MARKSFKRIAPEISEAATHSGAKPGDYELCSLESRGAARALLHARLLPTKNIRMIIHCSEEPLNLETSTCQRMLWPGGVLVDLIELDGNADELTDEELQQFVKRFPIKPPR